jgi:signal transduction histidine kinase
MENLTEVPVLRNDGMRPPPALIAEPASVLIVDDNAAMLHSLAAVVKTMGLEVAIAASGREALRQLLQRDFAVVLLDINMPGMDGFETASLIRGRPRSAHLPIIFITAEAEGDQQRLQGYQLGAVDIVYSPVLPEILRAKLQVFADLYYLNRRLQRQTLDLQQRSHELNRKNRDLEEANQLKSQFLATMSHELRTPLNAIIGFADALAQGLAGTMTAEQREYLGDILTSGEHLLALINDVLDLSKIEAGRIELLPELVEVGPLLQDSLSVIRERAARRRIAIDTRAGMVGSLWMDPRYLRQILFNLLSNAEKFTPEGGRVTLEAHHVARTVPEGCPHRVALASYPAAVSHYLEIRVSDTGIGIAPADQARLFQPFVQLDSSLSRQFGGTGLGLAMVKRLVELHHGYLAMESVPGQGSAFTVWFPLLPAPEAGSVHGTRGPAAMPRLDAAGPVGAPRLQAADRVE